MNFIVMYRIITQKTIDFIEKHEKYIPFSKALLWYMKRTWFFKFLIGIVIGLFTFKMFYEVGFIVLQSKAKNEVLSIITANQNPINFNETLVLKYSFIFCFIFLCAFLPFVLPCIIYIFMKDKIKVKEEATLKERIINRSAFLFFYLLLFCLFIWLVLSTAPYIVYIMLYKSKDASFLEYIIRLISGEISSIPNVVLLSYEYLSSQIKYSLLFEVWVLFLLFSLLFGIKFFLSKRKSMFSKIVYSIAIPLISVFILFVLISHTFYITGNFGKGLSNFDMDFVHVDFELNGIQSIQGIRVFEKGNQLIIRDSCNITHNIISENIHLKTINELAECKTK
jgi:hypothetical protein